MPIYEYVCEKCGNLIEVMQKVSDEPLKRCTKCRGKLEKIFSRTSFQLKGSGWYKSDYSSSGAKPKPKEENKPKEEKKPEGKAETSSSSTTGSGGSDSGGSGKSD
jgi:putative FmdB family regulatory protein